MTTESLPRLLDRRRIAAELGLTLTGAERVMRDCPKVWIGRRVYVERTEIDRYLRRAAKR